MPWWGWVLVGVTGGVGLAFIAGMAWVLWAFRDWDI
jgi:hypothetical protein